MDSRGFIPPVPAEIPGQRSIVFGRTRINTDAIRLGGRGHLHQWSLAWPAHPHNSGEAVRQLEAILRGEGLTDQLVDNLLICIGEIVPNAFQHGQRGSRVGIVLLIHGQRPQRVIEILVENFIDHQHPIIGPQIKPQDFARILDHLRGRGLAMSVLIADELVMSIRPGYSVLITALFDEASPKHSPTG